MENVDSPKNMLMKSLKILRIIWGSLILNQTLRDLWGNLGKDETFDTQNGTTGVSTLWSHG